MTEYQHQVHVAIQLAQQSVRQAQTEPDQALQPLQQAGDQLRRAYQTAQQYADPNALQQIQDAENAVGQAYRTVEDLAQSPIQTHNAIDQALRACIQIRNID